MSGKEKVFELENSGFSVSDETHLFIFIVSKLEFKDEMSGMKFHRSRSRLCLTVIFFALSSVLAG